MKLLFLLIHTGKPLLQKKKSLLFLLFFTRHISLSVLLFQKGEFHLTVTHMGLTGDIVIFGIQIEYEFCLRRKITDNLIPVLFHHVHYIPYLWKHRIVEIRQRISADLKRQAGSSILNH